MISFSSSFFRPLLVALTLTLGGVWALSQSGAQSLNPVQDPNAVAEAAKEPNPFQQGVPSSPGSPNFFSAYGRSGANSSQPIYVTFSLVQGDSRFARLTHTVDVQLDHASVRQLADALTRASGVIISVDKLVPDSKRMTLDAQSMPLASVLEAVGRETGLMLAPDKMGVTFKKWPSLQVDGSPRQEYVGPLAPWSSDWVSAAPKRNAADFQGGRPPGDNFYGGLSDRNGLPVGNVFVPVGPGAAAVGALGDHTVVVAEQSVGGKGEAGILLTFYAYDGNHAAKKMHTLFHPYANGGRNAIKPTADPRGKSDPAPVSGTASEEPRAGSATNPTAPKDAIDSGNGAKNQNLDTPSSSPGSIVP